MKLFLSSCTVTTLQRCSEARAGVHVATCKDLGHCRSFRRQQHRKLNPAGIPCAVQSRVQGSQLPLDELKIKLETAVAQEDYETAAGLRDELSTRRHDNRVGVEEANQRFYAAMQNGDLAAMEAIWGQGPHVQCLHPASNCLAGRSDVMAGWRLFISGHGRPARLRLEDVRIHAYDSSGWVTCTEMLDFAESRGRIAATNIFEKQDGQWKIVHHQGADVPRP